MRRAVLCAGLAACCFPFSAGAQTLSLTESEALARLSPDGPRVRALRAPIEVARADVLAAGRWPNPRVSVERQSVAGVTEYYTSISQPLPVTGRRGFDEQAASALVQARSSRANDGVRRLRADLRLAFADLVAAQTRERELTASRDRLRELSQVLARRESAGDAAGFDRLRAEREVLDLESDLVIASTERATAQARLAGFFGDGTDASRLVAVDRSTPQLPVPALEVLVAQAESARGALTAFQHEVEAAGFAARAAERRQWPEPEIFGGTKSSTAGSSGSGEAVTVGAGAVGPLIGVQLTVPLFDRAKPERALAQARVAEAEAGAAALRAVVRAEAAALRESVIQRRAAAERYRAQGLDSAGQIERIAQVSYDAGERGILELLDAYRLGASARLRQTTLDLAARQAEIELGFTTGWEMPL
jgi:cobalt-zinc-cadmium efflux system outer membrane protein